MHYSHHQFFNRQRKRERKRQRERDRQTEKEKERDRERETEREKEDRGETVGGERENRGRRQRGRERREAGCVGIHVLPRDPLLFSSPHITNDILPALDCTLSVSMSSLLAGITGAGRFAPPNPAPSQRPMYPPDPLRRAHQQQPFYVGRTMAQPGSPYNSRHAREMGVAVDQGWSSFHPTGPVPSRHNHAPMRLHGQNSSSGSSVGGGGRGMASPNFGTVSKIMILLRGLPGSGKSTVAR